MQENKSKKDRAIEIITELKEKEILLMDKDDKTYRYLSWENQNSIL